MIKPAADDTNWDKQVMSREDCDLVDAIGLAVMDVARLRGASGIEMIGALELAKKQIIDSIYGD